MNLLIVRAGSENHIIISIVYEFVVLFWVERHAWIPRLIFLSFRRVVPPVLAVRQRA